MVDNLRSAVLQHLVGSAPVFNPKYADFARHWGFQISACNVRSPAEKGRVENAVGYVKKNFLAGLELPDFAALASAARLWVDTVADVRIHAATHERPIDRFEDERAHLQRLNPTGFDLGRISLVRASATCRVALESNHYSVPPLLAGQRLTLKAYPDRVCVYHQDRLVARHPRSMDRHRDIEDPEHVRALQAQRASAREQRLMVQWLALSPRAAGLRARDWRPSASTRAGISARSSRWPRCMAREAVARAIDDGLELQAFSAEYIANILAARRRSRRASPRRCNSRAAPTCSSWTCPSRICPSTTVNKEPIMSHRRHDIARQNGGATEPEDNALCAQLSALNLPFIREQHQALAQTAVDKHWSHLDYLGELAAGETAARDDRRVQRRIKDARFPVLKTLDQFDWNWPTRINRLQVQNLFHLDFVAKNGNVVFISATGLGKSHLMTALGHAACLRGHSVLFTGAIDIINTLAAAQAVLGGLKRAMDRYVKPAASCASTNSATCPIDKFGADCLFQILSHRYERGATLIDHEPRLQAVGQHLQQRQRAHLGAARPPAAPRRNRLDRGQELPHQGSGRRLNRPQIQTG